MANVTVSGNKFLYGVTSGTAVDLSASGSATSATVSSFVIDGNNAILGSAIAFLAGPSANQNTVTKLGLGENVLNGGVHMSHCTTAIVHDASASPRA